MGYSYTFHPKAEEELFDAIDYLDNQRAGYGALLAEVAADLFDQITEYPERFPIVQASAGRRRAMLTKPFDKSYSVYFDFDGTEILIVSFFNNRRNPSIWKERD